MSKGRVLCWILCLIAAFSFFMGEDTYKKITAEKLPLYVYAPEDMETAFEKALKSAGLKGTYKITMTDDVSKANIVVEMGKEFDSEYTKIAYSPFVVAYSSEDNNLKKMVENGLLEDAFFNDDYKEIVFGKLIEEVVGEGKWENLGVKDMGSIKVYYPAPGTKYYTDYYDFMLVTVNGGIYPNNESDFKKAIEQIELFEKSDFTEAVNDFEEKFNRTGGFMENILYLIPEQEAASLASNNKKFGRLFYPTATVYANYYVKADELGKKVLVALRDPNASLGDFYYYLRAANYRSDYDNVLNGISEYLYDERDVYNVRNEMHLRKDRIRPEALEETNAEIGMED